ncbi:hypothetical protein [Apilactobacillus xinyiensis]|uniref:hypothetical protein n=1 Tax=Apilactobacillus xinyiensis TaxID=2841032 RepID=UPI00200F4F0A|nr:hypothetical protein [Apilactobacillus xinyiensis]MCL0330531.1 hypothetical protein [Apilactobacillus xinyiensis]
MTEQLDSTKLDNNAQGLNNGQPAQPQNGVADNNGNGTVEGSNNTPTNDHTDGTNEKAATPKKVISKKFHQENFESSNGNKYLMTFPGMRRAAKLRNDANGITELHKMYMKDILEGKYDYATFDDIKGDIDRTKEVTVTEDDGTQKTYHINFKSIKQIDDMTDSSSDNLGRPSDYLSDEYIFENLVEEDVNYDYFDTHAGFTAITNAAMNLYSDLMANSEFAEVMNAVNDFLNKMFR